MYEGGLSYFLDVRGNVVCEDLIESNDVFVELNNLGVTSDFLGMDKENSKDKMNPCISDDILEGWKVSGIVSLDFEKLIQYLIQI